MKTSFDLPEPLLRRAKAVAAEQGRALRDLVAEAIEARLAAPPAQERRSQPPDGEWQAYLATLVLQPDGSYVNPHAADDVFFEALDEIRAERLHGQLASFERVAPAGEPRARRRRKARAP